VESGTVIKIELKDYLPSESESRKQSTDFFNREIRFSETSEPIKVEKEYSVLIVDDEIDIREFLSQLLLDEGYSVKTAQDGLDAIRLLRQGFSPDLIFLDMRMPGMDGASFAERYRQLNFPPTKIVVMTAAAEITTAVRRVNPDSYLSKPFELNDLLALVEKLRFSVTENNPDAEDRH
jgi:CheY-like chemotaxis protein